MKRAWSFVGSIVVVAMTATAVPMFPNRTEALPAPTPTLSFTAAPASADPGTTFATAPAVQVTNSTSAVTLSLVVAGGSPTGTLSCTSLSVVPTAGTSTFSGCSVSKGGRYKLRATLGGVTADSSEFLVSGPAWVEFATQPTGGEGGAAWSGQPVARVVNGSGTVISSSTAKIGLAIKPGTGGIGGVLTCNETKNAVTAVSGVATFTGCSIDRAGTGYQLLAIDVTDGVYGVSNSFAITAGDPAALAFTTQPLGGAGGASLDVQPVVAVVDAVGNPVPGNTSEITLAITASTGTPGANLTCTTNPVSASNGFATFSGCGIDSAGEGYTLTASATGLTSAVSDAIDITAGSAAGITFSTQPSGGPGGVAFTTQPVIAVDDDGGNGVEGNVSLSIKVGTGTAGAVLTCEANPTAATSGAATFSGCSIDRTGTGYVLVAALDSLEVESDPFDISAGSASSAVFTTQPVDSTGGVAFATQPVVEVRDAGGNLAAGAVTLALVDGLGRPGAELVCDQTDNTVSTVAGVATFSGCSINLAAPGYRLVATVGGSTTAFATSNSIDITTGVPARLTFRTSPGGGTGGTAWEQQPVVAVEDAGGNAIVDSTLSVDLVVTSGTGAGTLTCAAEPLAVTQGLALFAGCAIDRAGSAYTLTATSGTLPPAVSDEFAVAIGEPVGIDFVRQPGDASVGQPFGNQPAVAVVDAGNNPVPDAPGAVSLAITDGSGSPGAALDCSSTSSSVGADGIASFSGCAIDEVGGGYALTATWNERTTESLGFPVTPSSTPPLEQAPTGVPIGQTMGTGVYAVNPTSSEDGVNSATGALQQSFADLFVAGVGQPLELKRSYHSLDSDGGYFGPGWTSIFDLSVSFNANRTVATVRGEDGQRINFQRIGTTNNWAAPAGARASLKCAAKTCTVTRWDGTNWKVTGSRLEEYEDANGKGLRFIWLFGRLVGVRLTSTDNKRPITVAIAVADGRITEVITPTRRVGYGYTGGLLTSVTDVRGYTWQYSYDPAGRLAGVVDPLGEARLDVEYGVDGRVTRARSLGSSRRFDNTFAWDASTQRSTRTARVNTGIDETNADYVDEYRNNVLIRQEFPGGSVMRYSYDTRLNLVAVQDPNGFVQENTYSAQNDLISQRTPLTSTTASTVLFTYDKEHRLRSQTDANGNTTQYEYAGGRLHKIIPPGPEAAATHLHYNGLGLLTETVAPYGKREYRYDNAGNQVRMIERNRPGKSLNGAGTLARFDEAGNRVSSIDARGTTRPLSAAQFTSTWQYDAAGNLTTSTDPNGAVTTFTYDSAGTLIGSATPAGTTTYTWNEATRTRTASGPDGTSSQQFDHSGNVVREVAVTGGITRHRYDGLGRKVLTTDAAGQSTRYTYDSVGNVLEIRDTTTVFRQQFDSLNRSIRSSADDSATLTRYDAVGNVVWRREGTAQPVVRTYDARNNLTSVTDGAGTTSYEFDLADNVTRRTDGRGGVTSYGYDGMGRVTSMMVGGNTTLYANDEAGQRVGITDPEGRVTRLTLDGLNQVLRREHSAPGLASIEVEQDFDWQGRRTSMTDANGRHDFDYDERGNLVSAEVAGGTFGYDYGTAGQIVETYPDGTVVTYDVDDTRAIMGLTSGTVGTPGYVRASYLRDAERQSVALTLSNGVVQTRTYDGAGNITAQSVQHLGTVLAGDVYTYDNDGNRTSQRSTALGLSVLNAYRYDALNRLSGFGTSSTVVPEAAVSPAAEGDTATPTVAPLLPMPGVLGNGAPQPEGTPDDAASVPAPNYAYDGVGNITDDPLSSYQHGTADQITAQSGPTTWSHDRSGAVTATSGPSGSATYSYDAAGRLVSATVTRSGSGTATVTYAYDGDGNRISRTQGSVTTQYVWDPFGTEPLLVLEREDGNVVRRYFHGDGPVAMQTPSETYFFHLDPVGSTNQLTDSTGAVVAAYSYDGFGAVTERGTAPAAVDLLFQAQQLDRATGLYNMRARNYDPTTGRFTQREPVETPVGVAVVSAYSFVGNRPTYATDPSGMTSVETRVFAGQKTENANIANNAKYGTASLALTFRAIGKIGGYTAATTAKTITAQTAQLAKVGTNLKYAGRAASVIGIGLQAYVLAENCKAGDVAKCTGAAVGLALNIGFTVGCSFVSGGVATAACAIGGALLGVALEFVISEYGEYIAENLITLGYMAAPYVIAGAKVAAEQALAAGRYLANLGQETLGSLTSGFNTATEALSTGFQVGIETLIDAGYVAAELATVFADNFVYGAEQAIAGLVGLGYSIAGAAEALATVFAQTAAETAALVRDVLVGSAEAVADALVSAYDLTAEGVATALKAAGYAVNEVASAVVEVFDSTVEELAAALDAAGYGIKQIGAALQDVAGLTADAMGAALQGLGEGATAVAEALRDLYGMTGAAAAAALKALDYAVTEVAAALKDAYAATAAVATSLMKGAGYLASAVAEGLQSAYSAAAAATTQLLKEAGFLVSDIATALKDVYGKAGQAAAALLKGAGFAVTAVASALRDVYSLGSQAAAQILKNISYAANEVMSALKTTFSLANAAAAAVMKNISYAVGQVASALRDVYGTAAEATAQILKNLSYSVDQIGSVLKTVFAQGAAVAAQVLENIGYTFSEIGTVLNSVFGTAAETAAQILKDLGATASEIAGVLEDTFNQSVEAIGGFLSSIGFNDDTISAIGGEFESWGEDIADFFGGLF